MRQPMNSTTTCECCGFDPEKRMLLNHADKRVAYGKCRVCGMEAVFEMDTCIGEVDYHVSQQPAPVQCRQPVPPRERSYVVLPPLIWRERLHLWWTRERTWDPAAWWEQIRAWMGRDQQ